MQKLRKLKNIKLNKELFNYLTLKQDKIVFSNAPGTRSGFGKGFVAGFGNLGLAMATFGVSIGLSLGNAFLGGYYDIYSNDDQGLAAFWLDHTIGQGTTAIGTGNFLLQQIGGAHFRKDLSKGSNSFIFTNTPFRPSGVGNVAAVKNTDNLAILREELLHNWQYRFGGLLNLGRLVAEQIGNDGQDYPYFTPGTLEEEASNRSRDGASIKFDRNGRTYYDGRNAPRPWELQCSSCNRFF